MAERTIHLSREPDEIARHTRLLSASIAARILKLLIDARTATDGWLFLSEIAQRLDEKPGTVGLAIARLDPYVEERREKGKRFFRARVREITLTYNDEWGRGRQERLL